MALALLILGALVWVITAGPDGSSAAPRVTSLQEKKAVRLEEQLAKEPDNEKLLLQTMMAWIRAGADRLEKINTDTQPIPSTVPEDYKAGLQTWNEYLKQTDGEANRKIAETAGVTYFQLVEIGSTSPGEATANAAGAVKAQQIVCEHDPILYTLSELAIYQYFNGEYAAGDRAAKAAAADKSGLGELEPKDVIGQLNEYKERGEKFVARVKRGFETLEETGEEELETPIKGYGSAAGLNGYEPGEGPGDRS
ncbi:MAG TPA: hypothetical protein VIS95_05255 [Solirubrobacterales bacterium]